MSRSYVTLKKSTPVIIGYVCSSCGCPVVSKLFINTEAVQYYNIFETKAYEKASEKNNKAIQSELNRIENCNSTSTDPLYIATNVVSKAHYGNYCTSSISGIYSCPNCKHIEKWQSPTGTSSNETNYPKIYKDIRSAKLWAGEIIRIISEDIDIQRNNPSTIEKAIAECSELLAKTEQLEINMTNIPELTLKAEINNNLTDITNQKNKLGILDLKGKRNADKIISELNDQLLKIEHVIKEKERKIKDDIECARLRLQRLLPIAYGYTNYISSIDTHTSSAYFITPIKPSNDTSLDNKLTSASTTEDFVTSTLTTPIVNKELEIKFCNKCGFKLLNNSDFCSHCGHNLKGDI